MHYVHIVSYKRDLWELVRDEGFWPIKFCIRVEDLLIHRETVLLRQV